MTTAGYHGVGVDIGSATLLREVTFTAAPGSFLGVIGPNGSGKSTLLRCLYRAQCPTTGHVEVDGVDVTAISMRDNARQVAALTQSSTLDFDFTAAEVVASGRFPHRSIARTSRARDAAAVEEAMGVAGVGHLADRVFTSLSGGEAQRVLIARVLAQQPRVMVLDEPTNHLDVRHQFSVLAAARDSGVTVVAALHDLNIAAQFCDTLLVLVGGRVVGTGTPEQVLVPANLRAWFDIDAHIVRHPRLDVPQILFDERQP
ncbi:putative iron compound ABC transporter, ATP-binding protein [Gordonia polyisoprenivorans VH2]|uniref:ABC transporter ATP-binding protein n=2 Tax=Gordonia polyisoprenivorans TaxID=84595 RepID=A0A846WI33_9ACTN|nr:ABC transporter ATP-binding protein [Gordonia polyisoprenivorans]AFA72583.1 putative iron compound ABC transporter, ATP-binding protein [Gordonia polyisoprenivorans VH2]NKY01324.1 ABC transporter ATP-binding protein [Gordonia polyisoprenivorans]GAB25558.1 putative ABC transporter ATP-binding protein [Gordonia polyisoprenivorans NBRC 16320 = JCM 10675]